MLVQMRRQIGADICTLPGEHQPVCLKREPGKAM